MLNLNTINEQIEFEQALVPNEMLKINASIVKHNQSFFCAYRTDHIDKYDPKNYLTELKNNLDPISHKRLYLENGNTAFEDVRLFSFSQKLIAIYTCFEKLNYNKWNNTYKIEIGIVDVENGIIYSQNLLKAFSLRHHDKNWIPFAFKNYLFIVTDFDPIFRVLKATKEYEFSNFKEYFKSKKPLLKWDYGEFRGGTPFLPSDNDNWQYSFVHSSIHVPNGNNVSRFYFYTIVRYDPITNKIEFHKKPLNYSKINYNDLNYSLIKNNTKDPSIRVVFPMGILHYNNGLIVSFGKDDYVSRLQFYSWDFIVELFANFND